MINIPELIYRATDPIIGLILRAFIPQEQIRRRLAAEQRIFDKSYIDYALSMLNIIHDRAGSMVSHLSLMLALCMFLLQSQAVGSSKLYKYMVLSDTFIYLCLVLLSVRCLRSFGLDQDREELAAYEAHMETELTLKFSIMQVVNSLTICATIFLVGIMVMIYAV